MSQAARAVADSAGAGGKFVWARGHGFSPAVHFAQSGINKVISVFSHC